MPPRKILCRVEVTDEELERLRVNAVPENTKKSGERFFVGKLTSLESPRRRSFSGLSADLHGPFGNEVAVT